MFAASTSLFARCFSELIIVSGRSRSNGPLTNQTTFAFEFTFGLFSTLYVGFIWTFARLVSTRDVASTSNRLIEQSVRAWILEHLEGQTEKGRVRPPPFVAVKEKFIQSLNAVPATSNSNSTTSAGSDATQAAEKDQKLAYVDDLAGRFDRYIDQPI